MDQKNQPLVSIIMPVYNAGEFLVPALESIFSQSYQTLEVIAIDDASTDGSGEVLKLVAKKEERLRVIKLDKNVGPAEAANIGIKKAKGEYIARMDADDLMARDRIKKQVKYLRDNPETVVVGGQVELISQDGRPIVVKHFPEEFKGIVKLAFITMPIQQGAMMVNRKRLPRDFKWYCKGLKTSEDLDFLFRVFRYGRGANLPDILLHYRQHGESITQAQNPKGIFWQAFKIRKRNIQCFRGLLGLEIGALYLKVYLQCLAMLILPNRFIYPLYYFWRGLRLFNFPQYGWMPILRHAKAYLI